MAVAARTLALVSAASAACMAEGAAGGPAVDDYSAVRRCVAAVWHGAQAGDPVSVEGMAVDVRRDGDGRVTVRVPVSGDGRRTVVCTFAPDGRMTVSDEPR